MTYPSVAYDHHYHHIINQEDGGDSDIVLGCIDNLNRSYGKGGGEFGYHLLR